MDGRRMVGFVQVGILTALAGGAAALGAVMAPALGPQALRDAAQATLDAPSFTARVDVRATGSGGDGPAYRSRVDFTTKTVLVYQAPDRVTLRVLSHVSGPVPAGGTGFGSTTVIGSTVYQAMRPMGLHGHGGMVSSVPVGAAQQLGSIVTTYLTEALSATRVGVSGATYTFGERDRVLRPGRVGQRVNGTVAVHVAHGYVDAITAHLHILPLGLTEQEHVTLSRLGSSPPVDPPAGSGDWPRGSATVFVR